MALIAGGGIGGLAAALALNRAGWAAQVFEQAGMFAEVGAGIQLGPNVTRQLHAWGLTAALEGVAAFPHQLQVRDAASGRMLGELPLGRRSIEHYGAPYATIHRADLHQLLLHAVQAQGDVAWHLGTQVHDFDDGAQAVEVTAQRTTQDATVLPPYTAKGELMVGADGVWSQVRQHLLQDGPARPTGHLAYRALVAQADLPLGLRSHQVTVWLGPHLHVVDYPVRASEARNIVAFLEGPPPADPRDWDHQATAAQLQAAMKYLSGPLQALMEAVTATTQAAGSGWRLWALNNRPPMRGPDEHARGRVALVGDAAHPMLPYLAQGAGMAIEDAACLGSVIQRRDLGVPERLRLYAEQRWQRNARVQARAMRNGVIFHATGPVRWGRDLAMRALGARLLDMPWLYGGPT
jgi:salicylate hydroxylase